MFFFAFINQIFILFLCFHKSNDVFFFPFKRLNRYSQNGQTQKEAVAVRKKTQMQSEYIVAGGTGVSIFMYRNMFIHIYIFVSMLFQEITSTYNTYTRVQRLGLKIFSEEQVSIIIDINSEFLIFLLEVIPLLLNSNFLNKKCIQSNRF